MFIKTKVTTCIYCGKTYKTYSNLEKHFILCEISYKAKKQSKNNDTTEELIIPSQTEMYKILLELTLKCNRLEEKISKINKVNTIENKKINIIEYLNINKSPNIIFDDIYTQIHITNEDIEYLLYNSFNDTINKLFTKTLYKLNNSSLIAFMHNKNTLYYYENNELKWSMITNIKITCFLNKIQLLLSKSLYEWYKKNNEIIETNDTKSILYDKTVSKLMAPDFKDLTYIKKINNMIYSNIPKLEV